MAFSRENLTIIGNNVKAGVVPTLWMFHNSADDTVTASGYFADKRLVVGDIIMSLKGDSTVLIFYRVSALVAAGATVVALTTVTP